MISTLGYHAPSSPRGSKTRFSTGVSSPLQPQSSLFASCRRPSIPLSPGLLPLLSFPPAPQSQLDNTSFECVSVAGWSPAPVHRLPIEILCNIFSYCEAQSLGKCLGPKVTISHVCRRWRSVILCMPLLWTYVRVGNTMGSTFDRAASYLRRSGTCPVFLSVVDDPDHSSHQPRQVPTIWSLIQSQPHRFKSLHFELYGSIQSVISYLAGCQFPVLDSIKVMLRNCPPAVANELVSILQQGSSISSVVWYHDAPPVNVPWSQLTRLELHGAYSPEALCDILRRCREIRSLCVGAIIGDPAPSRTQIHVPHLRSITLSSLASLASIFSRIYAPDLHNVDLRYRLAQAIPRDWNAFGEMLNRSTCKLDTLAFSDPLIRETDLIQYLLLPPLKHLKTLRLSQPSVTDAIFNALVHRATSASFYPLQELESLYLPRCSSSDGLLRNFLLGPPGHGQPRGLASLRYIEVGLEGLHVEDIEFLHSLRSEKVDVTLVQRDACMT